MAEAAVEERPLQRFYCHQCNVRFESTASNFICPHCSNGFVEELLENDNNDEGADPDWTDDEINLVMSDMPWLGERRNVRSRSLDGGRSGRRTLTRISSNVRPNIPFENFIQDVIINLGVGVNWGNAANMQLFLGNPGDYAWGREGLDAIITQLLNQMDSTGPPPVSKEVIDALPLVTITDEQVEKKLQCSVCWEDFVSNELVRQLPCLHVYHEPCIRPWLELHGTCPICRQNLVSNEQSCSDNQNPSGATGEGAGRNALEVLSNLYGTATNFRNASSSSTSSDTSDSVRSRSSNSDSTM